jgi:hypothetical protein
MKKEQQTKSSRRKFLSLGLLGGAALISTPANSQATDVSDDDTIQMLTPDGKLVKVSRKAIADSQHREKAKNEDILKWSTANKSK